MSNAVLRNKFQVEVTARMKQIAETNMNPHQKLEFLKMSIRSIAIEIATNYKKERNNQIDNLRKDIKFWQSAFETAATGSFKATARDRLDEAICKRDVMLDNIGEFISKRLKARWYQEGEKGTKYFLNIQKSKGQKTELLSLQSDNGIVNDPEIINKMVESFYKKLYEKGDSKAGNLHKLKDYLSRMTKVNQTNIDQINAPITANDLLATLKTCSDSSPGPDGIPYSLIKFTWNYFGPLLIDSWNYSLDVGFLTDSHESSYLKLLPKEGKDTSLLKNWRPITLSNCDFKIITKTLANRLTSGLDDLISQNQTAYIKNHQITDNLHLIQHELENSYNQKIPMAIVSLDAEKAFDSVEHNNLREVLKK